VLVGEEDVFGVRGPAGMVVVGGVGAEVDDGGRLEAGLVAEVELVLAGGVGEVGEGLAVGRPGGVALSSGGGIGEVAGVAFFAGDGEDFAVRLKGGALAGGRKRGVADFVGGDGGEVRGEVGEVAVNPDLDGVILPGRKID